MKSNSKENFRRDAEAQSAETKPSVAEKFPRSRASTRENWKHVKLGEVIKQANLTRCGNRSFPTLSMTMHHGLILQSQRFKKEIASVDKSDYKIVKHSQLVVGFPIDEGVLAVQQIVPVGIVSPAYGIWDINLSIIFPRYLEIALRSPQSLAYYKAKLRGTTLRRRSLPTNALLELLVPLPPLDEQRKIAGTLDKVRELIDLRERELAKFDELVKCRFIEMFGDPVTNPKGWETKKLSEIASTRLGKMLDAKKQTGTCRFPYLANFNVQWFRFELNSLNEMDFNENDREEFNLIKGDLLVCEGGDVGRCAIWENEIPNCYFQKALHRVRCNINFVRPEYLARTFYNHSKLNGFRDVISGESTIAHLPGERLKKLEILLPPLSLQEEFARFVSSVDKSKFAVRQSLEKLKICYKSLMQEYFG